MKQSLIKRKLLDISGASMIYAMVAFLVIIMVCAVIISAAHSNMNDAKRGNEEEQAYLTVSSAAKLLKKAMEGDVITRRRVVIKKIKTDNTEELVSDTWAAWVYNEAAGAPDNPISDKLTEWTKDCYDGTLTSPESYKIKAEVGGENLEVVNIEVHEKRSQTFAATGNLDISAISALDSNDASKKNRMKLTMTAALSESSTEINENLSAPYTRQVTTTTTYTYTLGEAKIRKAGGAN